MEWLCAKNAQILHIAHQRHQTRLDATFSGNKDTPGNAEPPDPWEAAFCQHINKCIPISHCHLQYQSLKSSFHSLSYLDIHTICNADLSQVWTNARTARLHQDPRGHYCTAPQASHGHQTGLEDVTRSARFWLSWKVSVFTGKDRGYEIT